MANEDKDDGSLSPDHWMNSFEEECLEELDSEPNMEDCLRTQREFAQQKLWLQFQNSATSVAQLYKDRIQDHSVWIPFQNAASSVTHLYKDSVDSLETCVDVGVQRGKQHRTKDIISWVKKRRRHIRREDLIAFLCGKNPPNRHRTKHNHNRTLERSHSPRVNNGESIQQTSEPDLQAFREAISLQGLNGAMSNISVGYKGHNGPSNSQPIAGRNNSLEELNKFILDEFARNYDSRKRTSSPDHVKMDSPSRKKSRKF
ncbi:HUWE1-associated protein modifying stress responses-like [Mytilus galloprovincialis]|uniref:Uncharacterized protein n=2 Tax=Mytilus TaxID=6548 RepID=A0A8B6CAF3_MYTGA|nr:UPF0472 protein C16orf72 homolog,UPF0472 protein C16orf72 [Mytilus edulis]VDI02465.1 Hypothetical predicted protein [Mytilus galloprovincialis]